MALDLFTSSFALFFVTVCASHVESECGLDNQHKAVNVIVKSGRSEHGKWVTEFVTRGAAEEMAEGMKLNITTTLTTCDGVDFVNIRGSYEVDTLKKGVILNENHVIEKEVFPDSVNQQPSIKEPRKQLQFNERFDVNVELSNNLRTARRKNAKDEYKGGKLVTNRPLGKEELFEVSFDKVLKMWAGSIMVGVTDISPDSIQFNKDCDNPTCGIWQYSDSYEELEVGDRVGVSRIDNGTLVIAVNSKIVSSFDDVPETVYGYVNLYGAGEQATILSP